MILLYGLAAGIVIGLLTGGRVHALVGHRICGATAFLFLFVVQLLVPRLPIAVPDNVMVYLFWVLPVAGCLFIVLLNLREPGFLLVSMGLAANLLVVTANGGMPVLALNSEITGGAISAVYEAVAASPLHVPAGTETAFLWLGDVIPIPEPGSVGSLVSLGDTILSFGLGLHVFVKMHDLGKK